MAYLNRIDGQLATAISELQKIVDAPRPTGLSLPFGGHAKTDVHDPAIQKFARDKIAQLQKLKAALQAPKARMEALMHHAAKNMEVFIPVSVDVHRAELQRQLDKPGLNPVVEEMQTARKELHKLNEAAKTWGGATFRLNAHTRQTALR
jgi:hypothetical protein